MTALKHCNNKKQNIYEKNIFSLKKKYPCVEDIIGEGMSTISFEFWF